MSNTTEISNITTPDIEFVGNSTTNASLLCENFDIEKEFLKSFGNTRLMIIISRLGFLSGIILIGLIGNTLSYIVMYKDKAGKDGNWMLRAVAVNDNIFLIAMFFRWVTLEIYFQTAAFSHLRHWYPHIFPFFFYLGAVTLTTSHYTLVVATIERYIAVCKPHRIMSMKKHTRRAVLALPVVAAVIKLPQAFRYKKTEIPVCGDHYAKIGYLLYQHNEYKLYESFLYGILHTFLPILILIFCNVNMIRAVRSSKQIQSTSQGTADARLTVMLVTVVMAFIVCNLPISVVWILEMLSVLNQAKGKTWFFYLWVILELLVVLNSAINCFIYCFVGKKFRNGLFQLICCKRQESEMHSNSNPTMECSSYI